MKASIASPRILLIITGSVAAYKAMDLIRILRKNSFDVHCILTKAACEFITPLLATSLTGHKTHQDLFSSEDEAKIGHISLARNCDLVLVAPASADFLAKMANGYADDLASTVILACDKPIFVAPAMNEKMWLSASNQQNISRLKARGVHFIEPQTDILACGEFGIGKIAAVEEIHQQISEFFTNKNLLAGKKIIITGGATIEPIDPVRFIGNYSSGKQALAIIKNLLLMGAEILFIAGRIDDWVAKELPNIELAGFYDRPQKNSDKKKSNKLTILKAQTAQEMLLAVEKNLKNCDVFIGCAAVSDFFVINSSKKKIKKTELAAFKELGSLKNKAEAKKKAIFSLELGLNPDILGFVGNHQNRPKMVVGFAAESENLIENATKKLFEKNCDVVVANNISNQQVFGSDQTNIIVVSKPKRNLKNLKNSELDSKKIRPQKLKEAKELEVSKQDFGKISKHDLAKILSKKIAEFSIYTQSTSR